MNLFWPESRSYGQLSSRFPALSATQPQLKHRFSSCKSGLEKARAEGRAKTAIHTMIHIKQ